MASTLGSQALGCALVAVLFGSWRAMARRRSLVVEQVEGRPQSWKAILGTALVLAGPALAETFTSRHLGPNNVSIALALTPAVIAVLCSSTQQAPGESLAGLLWPGLGGLAGLLLIVPEPSFSAWTAWLSLSSMPLFTGSGAFWVSGQSEARACIRQAISASGCGLAGTVLLALAVTKTAEGGDSHTHCSAACLDGLCVVLSLLSLKRLGAARWSAQFLLIPFTALVEGVALLHPPLDGRSWIGLALLSFGAVRLLLYRGPERSVALRL